MSDGWAPLLVDSATMARNDVLSAVMDSLGEVFRSLRAGEVDTPARMLLKGQPDPPPQLLVSPAMWEQQGVASVKITTLTPGNPDRGLPLIHGVVAVIDLATGRVEALLDGAGLTAVRTGGVAGVATRLCAAPDVEDAAFIGTGVQARALVRAMVAVRPITSIRLFSRTRARAEQFSDWIKADVDATIKVMICPDVRTAIHDAGIVCTATSVDGGPPLVLADWLAPGAHLNVIGGANEDAVEIEPAALSSAFVVVEQIEAALEEAGEVRAGLATGRLRRDDLHELGALVGGEVTPPTGATTIFRAVGLGIEDTAAAAAICRAVRPAP